MKVVPRSGLVYVILIVFYGFVFLWQELNVKNVKNMYIQMGQSYMNIYSFKTFSVRYRIKTGISLLLGLLLL